MIVAIVVLFHPDQRALERLQSSLGDQVNSILMIDNTPGASGAKPDFLGAMVSYFPLGENKGIAEAQNIGIEWSIERGYSHVLLLDQDSIPSPEMVSRLLAAEKELLNMGERVAAVTPQMIDERTGPHPVAVRYGLVGMSAKKVYRGTHLDKAEETDSFVASGSLIRVETLEAIGGMRSDLFIEYVDTEWALRARTSGFKSFCVPSATLKHCFGDGAKMILGKSIYLYNDRRYCYKMRNSVYLLRLGAMGWRWKIYNLTRIPYHLFVYSLSSIHPLRTFSLLLKVMGDGWNGRLGPYSSPAETETSLRSSSDDSERSVVRGAR